MKAKATQQTNDNGNKAVAYLLTGLGSLIAIIALISYSLNGTL